MAQTSTSTGGIGFPGLLTIVFIVLKLTDVIGWSWVWVLSPLWITFILAFVIGICAIFLANKENKTVHGALRNYERSLRK